MNTLNVKKGDTVVVLTGKDKGKKSQVIATSPKSGKILVAEVNMQKKHVKPKNSQQAGGIVDQAGAIDVSNVMVICPKCGKATRVANVIDANGKKIRACKKCGAELVVKTEKATKKTAKSDEKKAKTKKSEATETPVEATAEAPKAKKTTAKKAEGETVKKTTAKKAPAKKAEDKE